MQRKQLERLKGATTSSTGDGADGSSRQSGSGGISSAAPALGSAAPGGSSHSTLDPASVEFAVSALLSTTEVSGMLNSLVSSPSVTTTAATPADGHSLSVTAAAQARLAVAAAAANGPSVDAARAAGEVDTLRMVPKQQQQPEGQIPGDAGAEADSSHVMAALPPAELGNKLPGTLTDLRYSILEQNGNEGNKARRELSGSLGRVKLEPDGALPMDVT
ncbi:hypothetical protein V5799_016259 [Amblyomma americanum]|uniref:Uncharacterized protein n=1 Tax=Amblyomma americanum TaxID=6943 RepID=A0AAQ4F5I8_AMBAM